MNTRLLISISGLLLIYGCSKSADELFEISNENLKNDETDKAITGYEKLLYKYPEDTLASQVQYKLATLHLNWKNDLIYVPENPVHRIINFDNKTIVFRFISNTRSHILRSKSTAEISLPNHNTPVVFTK